MAVRTIMSYSIMLIIVFCTYFVFDNCHFHNDSLICHSNSARAYHLGLDMAGIWIMLHFIVIRV